MKPKFNGQKALVIEDGIPIPGRRYNAYPDSLISTLGRLKVGQSVLLTHISKPEQLGSVRAIVQGKFTMKLTTRTVEGGVRVWRVS